MFKNEVTVTPNERVHFAKQEEEEEEECNQNKNVCKHEETPKNSSALILLANVYVCCAADFQMHFANVHCTSTCVRLVKQQVTHPFLFSSHLIRTVNICIESLCTMCETQYRHYTWELFFSTSSHLK